MSIADLKMRLADVAGIETLSMALEAGRIVLRWGTAIRPRSTLRPPMLTCEAAVPERDQASACVPDP